MKLSKYKSIIFDCDGVILNSNMVKTQAFYLIAKLFGDEIAVSFIKYHKKNGGISRHLKIKYLVDELIPRFNSDIKEASIKELTLAYANNVIEGLKSCEISRSLDKLRNLTQKSNWLIVSGGDQLELRHIFSIRKLDYLFESGIFGCPENKEEIVSREISRDNIKFPGIFIGDSKYDYQVACKFDLDFIFLTNWTEVKDSIKWCKENDINYLPSLHELYKKQLIQIEE